MTEQVVQFGLGRPITWLVEQGDPDLWPVGNEGWAVVSPRLYPSPLGEDLGLCTEHGRIVLSTDMIAIAAPDGTYALQSVSDIWLTVRRLLMALRYASGQASIPRHCTWMTEDRGLLRPRELSWEPPSGEHHVNTFYFETALSMKHVEQAVELGSALDVPGHAAVFLDAMEAFTNGDYRGAQFYATIACESGAATALDARHRHLASGATDARHRFVVLGGATKPKKDPVFEMLRRHAKFKHFLHELPLYVLGRSLLLENEALYAKLLRLATRNAIAHTGDAGTTDVHLKDTREDAQRALQWASDLLVWFDLRPRYTLPDSPFTKFVDGQRAGFLEF
jgi:hypothetical protein